MKLAAICVCLGITSALFLIRWGLAANTTPQAPGVELGPDYTRQAEAGETISYNHILTNTSTTTDTFLLEVLSTQGWSVELLSEMYPDGTALLPLQVAPEVTVSFQVSLTIPLNIGGVTEITIITATSQLSPSVQANAFDKTIVHDRVYLPMVARHYPPIFGGGYILDLNAFYSRNISPLTGQTFLWVPHLFYSEILNDELFCPGHPELTGPDDQQFYPDGCAYTASPGCFRPGGRINESMDVSPYPYGTSWCIGKLAPVFSYGSTMGIVKNVTVFPGENEMTVNVWHTLTHSITLYSGETLPSGTRVFLHYGHLQVEPDLWQPGDIVYTGDLIGHVSDKDGAFEFGVFYVPSSDQSISIDPVLLGMTFPGSHDPDNP